MKNIVVIGSTGSIGKQTIEVIRKYKNKFNIKLLSTNNNLSEVIKQAKEFNVKNIVVTNDKSFILAKKKYKKTNFIFHNNFDYINKIFKKKEIFYTMISIVGLDGLVPSLEFIKYSKNIGIVNKETIICAWSLIKKSLKKYKTNFIPIDSEHFSIYSLLNNDSPKLIDKIYITASGGPFLKKNLVDLKRITLNEAIKHPNWRMGKKISIDSSTMMNKVFEVIEAKKIFDLNYKDIKILIHPKSYVHAILKLKNGLTKILIHEPDMKIPIHNSIFQDEITMINLKQNIDIHLLNNLDFRKINYKKFPLVKVVKNLKEKDSLYETVLITINDYFVLKFLKKKITYLKMLKSIFKYSNLPYFLKYREIKVRNINQILNCKKKVCMKLDLLSI